MLEQSQTRKLDGGDLSYCNEVTPSTKFYTYGAYLQDSNSKPGKATIM